MSGINQQNGIFPLLPKWTIKLVCICVCICACMCICVCVYVSVCVFIIICLLECVYNSRNLKSRDSAKILKLKMHSLCRLPGISVLCYYLNCKLLNVSPQKFSNFHHSSKLKKENWREKSSITQKCEMFYLCHPPSIFSCLLAALPVVVNKQINLFLKK